MDICKRNLILIALATALTFAGGCSQSEKSHDEIVREDLLLIIETLGKPCNAVSEYELVADLRYEIQCDSGDSYTINVSDIGHVEIN